MDETAKKQLKNLGVELLVEFGSQVEGYARSDSDYDVGVFLAKSKEKRVVDTEMSMPCFRRVVASK